MGQSVLLCNRHAEGSDQSPRQRGGTAHCDLLPQNGANREFESIPGAGNPEAGT